MANSVLIVDDNAINAKLARFVLESAGYAVDTASNAQNALTAISTKKPELILMDLQLPDIDGLTLTKQIKADPETSDILIVALTAYAMKGDREKSLAAGCDAYIAKPIDTDELPGAVRACLERQTPDSEEALTALRRNDSTPPARRAILLVDDNTAVREAVQLVLTGLGYSVLLAPDGSRALTLMEAHRPELVLLDLVLPDTDGFCLVEKLRACTGANEVPIVAMSGYLSERDEARMSAVGFDEVIMKPVDARQLASVVQACLPKRLGRGERFGNGKSVLLVDDDPLQLRLASFRFGEVGFEVRTAMDGQDALTKLRQRAPDVLVADVLMPTLDGFQLCAAVRKDAALAQLPILLVTSAYVEAPDRKLAQRVGANDLVVRTPDLDGLMYALQRALSAPPPRELTTPLPEIEHERARRVVKQLERQVYLNRGLAKSCSTLSAELSVLTRISESVLRLRDFNSALDEALAGFFDAGGVSAGVLYILELDGTIRARPLGQISQSQSDNFFGHLELVARTIETQSALRVPSADVPHHVAQEILGQSNSRSILMVPLAHLAKSLGALVIFREDPDIDDNGFFRFVSSVGNQISQVLALQEAFSAREKAEQLTRERTAFLDALLEQAPDSVVYVDPQGIVRYASQAAQHEPLRMTLGRSMFDAQSTTDATEQRSRLACVMATGEGMSWETSYQTVDGEMAHYWCKMGPVRRDGRVTGALIVARDITEKKRADAQLVTSDRMASVGVLSAGVAHEINNPLSLVIANLHLTRRDLRNPKLEMHVPETLLEGLNDACAAAERIRLIVKDLKMLSRDMDDEMMAVDAEQVIESTVRLALHEIHSRAKLVRTYEKVPRVCANESRLGQVVLNLIINAVQAIPAGDSLQHVIRVGTDMDVEGRVVIWVADTGSGIPDTIQKRLFTPFYTTKPVGVGTGLGLSICQRIVRSFGGEITFESEVGKGSKFQVHLPVAPSTLSTRGSFTTNGYSYYPRRSTVLVVDDEDMVGTAIRRTLEPQYHVSVVTHAKAALDLIRAGEEFDVILCDLMMPEFGGVEFLEVLTEISPTQADRLVFLTGGVNEETSRRLRRFPNHVTLEKPFSMDGLVHVVDGLRRTEMSVKP